MASSAHKTEEEKKEFFDDPSALDKKVTELAQLIKTAKHFIAFTGAGISTSTGIPDFRSGVNTVLKTGPGAWEKQATGFNKKPAYQVKSLSAIPSITHMALLALQQKGYLKFLISQNTDGLHLRSGFPHDKLAELHGNSNKELCKKCKKEYLRDFRVRTAQKVHDHETGRLCDNPSCKGKLCDTIINFGENLPEKEINDGFNHSKIADLCLCLGSSLRVTPAADMPKQVAHNEGGKIFIVNLQKTPFVNIAHQNIYGFCDQVMEMLMKKLDIEIPKFYLNRKVGVKLQQQQKKQILITGLGPDKMPFSLFPQVDVIINKQVQTLKKEPFKFPLDQPETVTIKLYFQGHYQELPFTFNVLLNKLNFDSFKVFNLQFDIYQKKWEYFEEP